MLYYTKRLPEASPVLLLEIIHSAAHDPILLVKDIRHEHGAIIMTEQTNTNKQTEGTSKNCVEFK